MVNQQVERCRLTMESGQIQCKEKDRSSLTVECDQRRQVLQANTVIAMRVQKVKTNRVRQVLAARGTTQCTEVKSHSVSKMFYILCLQTF